MLHRYRIRFQILFRSAPIAIALYPASVSIQNPYTILLVRAFCIGFFTRGFVQLNSIRNATENLPETGLLCALRTEYLTLAKIFAAMYNAKYPVQEICPSWVEEYGIYNREFQEYKKNTVYSFCFYAHDTFTQRQGVHLNEEKVMRQEKGQENKKILWISLLLLVRFVISLAGETGITVDNPYEGIVWTGEGAWQRHKANFHTHTTQSDGKMKPDVVIDHYHGKGYTILAITDHNKNTWPWTNWNRDPETLGILAIPGNELSSGHHRGSLFNTINGNPGRNVKSTLTQVADAGGLSMLYHPGRYSKSIEWYIDIYTSIPTCFGMEVFNQADRYPNDRAIWDAILTQLMPNRPVWGYANDDMHTTSHLFKGYNMVFVEDLTETQVRQALQSGRSYFSYEPGHTGDALAPSIESITVDTAAMTITISASAYNDIEWISSGNVVGNGTSFSYSQSHDMPYVRARIIGDYGETHTQPFGINSSL